MSKSDEEYILEICDCILGRRSQRQSTFDFLRGDTGKKLPVDAYYPELELVIEYRERQHSESVPFWDQKLTTSGVTRGVQRAVYDQRRRHILPQHGIALVELSFHEFPHGSNKRLRRVPSQDEQVIRRRLGKWLDDQ